VTYLKNIYFHIFLIIFILLGIQLSLNVGITHDEFHDYNVWIANKNIFINFFFKENLDTSYLSGSNKFYGSGFHYISSLFEFFFINLPQLKEYSYTVKQILSKHISVFLLFVLSGLVFRKILKLITNNHHHANLGTIFYLLYPYLLGHSFFNVKDIPFLTFWLICTFYIIKITKNYILEEKISRKYVLLVSFFTACLLSIRISGVLIFIQYSLFILTLASYKKFNLLSFLRNYYKEFLISISIILSIYIILQPSYLENPLLIYDAVRYMSQHIQTVCTITLGECMKAQNLPSSYLPIWFFFKIPLIILIGFTLFFIIESKIEKNLIVMTILSSLIFTVLSIIFLLIIFKVNLYDEIRQVMFLVPLIFIISLSLIYFFSKKVFGISISLFILFFAFQNYKIYPYNYIWINNLSHITKVQNVFELDYWGVSTKNISAHIKNNFNKNVCLITNRNNAINSLISEKRCLINFRKLHEKIERPFYVALMERGVNKGVPNNCKLIHEEKTNLNFSSETLTLAKIYKCD
tara:strand:- start:641 stop:2206 length:1566 start_codon:yes stop_codon:yes gene_type:complete